MLVAIIKDQKEDDIVTHLFKSIGLGFLLTIPVGILYWLYLISKVLGPAIWYIALFLLIVGIVKLFAVILGIGVVSKTISHSAENAKPKKTSNYYVQEFRAGQWIDLMGHYSLWSAYNDLDTRKGKNARFRVVDRNGNVQ